jgi:pyrroloquinoline quinone biosynthesis protein D
MALRNHDSTGSCRPLKLGPGVGLMSGGRSGAAMRLVLPEREVQLNRHALAILRLCDGSRSREGVVADAILRSGGAMRASDVAEFLSAAQSRGWIIEAD